MYETFPRIKFISVTSIDDGVDSVIDHRSILIHPIPMDLKTQTKHSFKMKRRQATRRLSRMENLSIILRGKSCKVPRRSPVSLFFIIIVVSSGWLLTSLEIHVYIHRLFNQMSYDMENEEEPRIDLRIRLRTHGKNNPTMTLLVRSRFCERLLRCRPRPVGIHIVHPLPPAHPFAVSRYRGGPLRMVRCRPL
jgi:hypothetical protein